MPRKSSINIGDRFGRLVVLEDLGTRGKWYNRYFLCKCDCGNKKEFRAQNLQSRHTTSCGCLKKEKALRDKTTHGLSKSRTHRIWRGIKTRCQNPKAHAYANYGGRGIRVCEEWQSFEPFWEWAQANGYNDTLSIDRVDVNGDYCPENCRWVDVKTQANNKRTSRKYTVKEKTLTEAEWRRNIGVGQCTISKWRSKRGEAYVIQRIEQALKEREEKEQK